MKQYYISGESTQTYNDTDQTMVEIQKKDMGRYFRGMKIMLAPHSVNVIRIV